MGLGGTQTFGDNADGFGEHPHNGDHGLGLESMHSFLGDCLDGIGKHTVLGDDLDEVGEQPYLGIMSIGLGNTPTLGMIWMELRSTHGLWIMSVRLGTL